jgi:hypothetical protein
MHVLLQGADRVGSDLVFSMIGEWDGKKMNVITRRRTAAGYTGVEGTSQFINQLPPGKLPLLLWDEPEVHPSSNRRMAASGT